MANWQIEEDFAFATALQEEEILEWEEKQERLKAEPVTVTYSYWDGSGHRREITLPKGTTVSALRHASTARVLVRAV